MSKTLNILLSTFLFVFSISFVSAQSNDLDIANQYFENEDFEKAKVYFEKVLRSNVEINDYYENYRYTLIALDEKEILKKFYKKLIKRYPNSIVYKIDQSLLMIQNGEIESGEKTLSKLIKSIRTQEAKVYQVANHFEKRNKLDWVLKTFLSARSVAKKYSYAKNLADVYYRQGNTKSYIQEQLVRLENEPYLQEDVQNQFQNRLKDQTELELLETELYARIQINERLMYNELLLWLYMQKNDFESAFVQAKAIELRTKNGNTGEYLMNVGEIAFNNHDYEASAKCFEYLVTKFPKSYYFSKARRMMIETKENLVKSTYPIQKSKITSLLSDYETLITKTTNNREKVHVRRSMARLQAFYLYRSDTAISLLKDLLQNIPLSSTEYALTLIDLGDIYLMEGNTGDASLSYKKAERKVKDSPTAYLAKLKDAKVSYYHGDFELAQDFLDILKEATSREISNNAIDLSLLITDNLGLDTTKENLLAYARIELLVYQHQYEIAFKRLDSMALALSNHSLLDEIYWLKGNIYSKISQHEQAIKYYQKIIDEYPEDILADNALFQIGLLYEENIREKDKAMEVYKQVIMNYPGSIFTAEARKRFRALRGDKLN